MSLSPTKGSFVIRLWNRVGVFRALAVFVLASGLAAGLLLAEHSPGAPTSSTGPVALDAAELAQLRQDLTEHRVAQDKANNEVLLAAERAKTVEEKAREASRSGTRTTTSGKPGVNAGPIPASCAQYTGNKAIGCTLLLKKGWGLDQMPCLDSLWTRESHWNTTAKNSSTGAYGIPQALPGSKMASAGSDWQTNPATQITWGLGYISGRYGTPCKAWSHMQSSGWY